MHVVGASMQAIKVGIQKVSEFEQLTGMALNIKKTYVWTQAPMVDGDGNSTSGEDTVYIHSNLPGCLGQE